MFFQEMIKNNVFLIMYPGDGLLLELSHDVLLKSRYIVHARKSQESIMMKGSLSRVLGILHSFTHSSRTAPLRVSSITTDVHLLVVIKIQNERIDLIS